MNKISLFIIGIASVSISFLNINKGNNFAKFSNQSVTSKAESHMNEISQIPTIVCNDNANINSLIAKYDFYLMNGKNYNFIVADTYSAYEKNF